MMTQKKTMRNLNRIIFINSANIPYADDIYLDGNVHFIGTQGVGKSTVLRAILFFYNADTQKLGIPVEKQSYTEYYFPYSNSYIVYEVATEHGFFCILSFKSMGRVCYRFIDSPYRKEFFIDENRTAYSGTDRIRAALDQAEVDYSRIIYTYDEYRNILYGNGSDPEMDRYALMESRQYQNIPRTIQNVFLNSKLDAEFIKKTIISSINEDETAIDLNTYKEHLKNFETRLHDVEEFQKRETQKLVKEITSLSRQVSRQQAALAQGCRELAAAHRNAVEALPQWTEKKRKAETERNGFIARRTMLQEQSRQRCDKMQEELAVLNNELQKAVKKEEEYAVQQIGSVIERSARKDEWKNRRQGLTEEQRILTSHYTEISTKYKSLVQNLDQQWNKIHEAKIRQIEELNNDSNRRIEEARRQYEADTEAVYQKFEELSLQLHPEKSAGQNELTALNYQMELCRKERYFEKEQEELKHRIQSYTGLHASKRNRIENSQLVIKELTLQWEEELQKGLKEKDEEMMRLQAEQHSLRPRVDELEVFLKNSKRTLQGWLKEHKKGWEDNIGKLCDESILWQTDLAPQLAADGGNSFYGINLALDAVDRHIKSINDYQAEKEAGECRLKEIASAVGRLQEEKEMLADQLKAKYQPRIKEQKDIISLQEYEIEKLEQQYQQDMLDLEEWKKKAEAECGKKLEALQQKKTGLAAELKRIDEKLGGLNEEKSRELNRLKQEWNALQQRIAGEKQRLAESVKKEDEDEKRRISAEKAEYESQMKQELHSQGADTERLQQIAGQLQDIDRELLFIKDHAALIIEYRKDKRDLIDNIPEWKRRRDAQKQELHLEKENLKKETASLQEDIDRLDKEAQAAEQEEARLLADQEAFGKIPAYDWFKAHQDIFSEDSRYPGSTAVPQKSCTELIAELNRADNQYLVLQNRLRKEVNLFTGHFDEDNTFKFQTKFTDDWEYVRFADELYDFVEENKISEFVRRINNEHSDIFKRISMDASMLTASEDDIQHLIGMVNKGFQTCNFVGVIQCIEMKVEESSNRVVNSLRAIHKYYSEHAYDLMPGTNLFSSENEQLVKQEAIALLRDFIKEIHACRYDSVRLYDSFELRFRIIENDNDTGFVEKLSNVGSEGTDILVKAMINIMLLNVFKESASRKFKDFKLHCMMDEIGKLHPNNVNGILRFANDRNIILINGSPTELNRDAYKHVYLLTKGAQSKTRIVRLISDQRL